MAVDIPAHLGLFQKLQIVLSRHKPHVIYLRDARCEELDRPCQKICLVVVSQRGIISTIHLINIQVIISGRIINLLYVCAVFKNILFRPVDFLIGKKILNVHHADPVMGIQCGKLLSGTDFQPFFQISGLSVIQGVNQKHGKSKVIDIIAFFLNLFLHGIMLMDFRKDFHMIGLQDFRTFIQQLPDIRLDKETAGAGFFGSVRKGIQADHCRAVPAHPCEVIPDKFFCSF